MHNGEEKQEFPLTSLIERLEVAYWAIEDEARHEVITNTDLTPQIESVMEKLLPEDKEFWDAFEEVESYREQQREEMPNWYPRHLLESNGKGTEADHHIKEGTHLTQLVKALYTAHNRVEEGARQRANTSPELESVMEERLPEDKIFWKAFERVQQYREQNLMSREETPNTDVRSRLDAYTQPSREIKGASIFEQYTERSLQREPSKEQDAER